MHSTLGGATAGLFPGGSPKPSLGLFHSDGLTKIATLSTATQLKWRDAVTEPGSVSFAIPEADAAQLTANRIVKVFWKGRYRIAARLKRHNTEFAVDGVAYRGYDSVPGALSMWNDAIVFPEYPLSQRTTGQQRIFGAMSNFLNHAATSWYDPADWHVPVGAPWSEAGAEKHKQPPGLQGPNPWWIGRYSPFTNAPGSQTQWFRRSFTTHHEITYSLYAAADDFLTLYLDGERIITPDQQNGQSWKALVAVSGVLPAGKHLLAAKVQNLPFNNHHNPVGFIMAMLQTKPNGEPVKGPPVIKTDLNWRVTDVRQGWHRSLVVRSLHTEAVARGVEGCVKLGITWDGDLDANGQPWSDKGEFIFDVAGPSLADIAQQQAEKVFDLHVNADRMTVGAFQRLGSDKSGSVALLLGKDGGNLLSHRPTRDPARFTSALLRLNDGTWRHYTDSVGISESGIVEVGVSLGSTSDDDTAAEVLDKAFEINAHELVSLNVESSCYIGPQPYQAFFPGDTVTVPDPDGSGTIKARTLALTIDCSGLEDPNDGKLHCYPEFVKDGSA